MLAPDKSLALFMRVGLLTSALVFVASCNRLATPPAKQVIKDADAKVAAGEFLQAINLYESALDGTARSADVHYRVALLYDDKLHDSLNAMHHFKRYLALAPSGSHAPEVKNLMKRDEVTLVTTLSGDSVVSRAEGARLRSENFELHRQLEERRVAEARPTTAAKEKRGGQLEKKTSTAGTKEKKSAKSYVVQPGDTLASISRKFYKSSGGWKKIRDSDGKRISNPGKLKPGETLTIP